MALNYNP